MNLISGILISAFVFFSGKELTGQGHYLLDHFSAYRDNDRIILTWTIGSGNSCIGIGVFRSTDNVEYENIHNIFGECGSPDFARFYSYVDENPSRNQTNFYVLELGFSGRTSPVSVRFDEIPENGSIVLPNPLRETGKILFGNQEGKFVNIMIFNSSGTQVSILTTNDNSVIIDASSLISGNYIYTISDLNNKIISQGKFVKTD